MTFFGIGLHIIIALFFAVHAVRTHQQIYWLLILFSFPLLGSLVYFLAIYLPESRLDHGARKMVAAAARVIDPERELREAKTAWEETPTAQNQMRLAAAQLERGHTEDAAQTYAQCLQGPFAKDNDIRYGAARAFIACSRWQQALDYLEGIRQDAPLFRPEDVSVLLARCYAGVQRNDEARQEFESAVQKYGTFKARAEYEIWAHAIADKATCERLKGEIDPVVKRWTPYARELNDEVWRRLQTARSKSF